MPKKQIPEAFKVSFDPENKLPFSPVVQIGNHFHFSGTLPDLDKDNKTVTDDIFDQTLQVMARMKKLLKKCGLSFKDVYSVTILTSDGLEGAYPEINKAYAEAFEGVEIMPRRKCFSVYELPFDVQVEIEFDAVKQD